MIGSSNAIPKPREELQYKRHEIADIEKSGNTKDCPYLYRKSIVNGNTLRYENAMPAINNDRVGRNALWLIPLLIVFNRCQSFNIYTQYPVLGIIRPAVHLRKPHLVCGCKEGGFS
jgi:hypothetical protein